MLKIAEYRNVLGEDGQSIRREQIDLKELEKFGFIKIYSYEDETDIYCISNEEFSGQTITVFCDDRTICASGYKILIILYDLIQAGLIKKE